ERPELIERVLPDYPALGKRILQDNGWFRALLRDNVELVTEEVAKLTAHSIVTQSGAEHDVDVVVLATGFHANKYLWPMEITSRDVNLSTVWGEDPRAYLGMTVPGFPNLFCLYGPNTNIVINGSIVYFSECGVRYILGLVKLLLADRHRALDVRKDVHDDFNETVDAERQRIAGGWSD